MNMIKLLSALSFCVLQVLADPYFMSQNIVGNGFYDAFTFESIRDPTNGRVEYVNRTAARWFNLTYADEDTFILRAQHTGVLTPEDPGRMSVRIKSREWYTTHVAVFDIRHLPVGCGTWPAVWETDESRWPYGGEIDIVEGVNGETPNAVTLHTGPGCTMPEQRDELGTPSYLDCYAYANNNAGCGVSLYEATNSFGPEFNSIGGGWYAMERNPTGIRVWFWARDDPSVPEEVQNGYQTVDPDGWGTPAADFPGTNCNIDDYFSANNIIINLTLCGDWAGNQYVYESSGCPATCIDFVNNNPEEFVEAYFNFASINIYLNE